MELSFNQTQHESLPNATQAQEIPDEELDSEDLAPLLVSLRFFKARYVHMEDQQSFFYEALRLNPRLKTENYQIKVFCIHAMIAEASARKPQRSKHHQHWTLLAFSNKLFQLCSKPTRRFRIRVRWTHALLTTTNLSPSDGGGSILWRGKSLATCSTFRRRRSQCLQATMTSTAAAHQVPVPFIYHLHRLTCGISAHWFKKQNVCAAGLVQSQFNQHQFEESKIEQRGTRLGQKQVAIKKK